MSRPSFYLQKSSVLDSRLLISPFGAVWGVCVHVSVRERERNSRQQTEIERERGRGRREGKKKRGEGRARRGGKERLPGKIHVLKGTGSVSFIFCTPSA